jgi:predicted transcriptional regulator
MEVHVKPEVQAKLDEIARESGQSCDEVVEDALIGYFDELAHLRKTLDRRYDEIASGKVKLIDGEEAYRRLMEKAETHRSRNQPG